MHVQVWYMRGGVPGRSGIGPSRVWCWLSLVILLPYTAKLRMAP